MDTTELRIGDKIMFRHLVSGGAGGYKYNYERTGVITRICPRGLAIWVTSQIKTGLKEMKPFRVNAKMFIGKVHL